MIALIGVSGIYGRYILTVGITNNKPVFLCLYSLGSIVFMLLFLIMGVFATVSPQVLINSCQSNKVNNDQDIQQTVTAAQSLLCKSCGCYFPNMNSSTYN